jgi:hypothetical protein
MKKLITAMALGLVLTISASANTKVEIIPEPTKVAEIKLPYYTSDIEVTVFCRNGLQWVLLLSGYKSGLSKDERRVDLPDGTFTTEPIPCEEE